MHQIINPRRLAGNIKYNIDIAIRDVGKFAFNVFGYAPSRRLVYLLMTLQSRDIGSTALRDYIRIVRKKADHIEFKGPEDGMPERPALRTPAKLTLLCIPA